jgi:tetratricopeptide (TPR) repeat protein
VAAGAVPARVLAHKPSKSARKELHRALHAEERGQGSQATRHFTEAIRLDPNYVEAEADLGLAYSRTGQPQAAIDVFDRALAIAPDWATLNGAKAAALVMLSRWGEAEQAARRAVHLDPSSRASNYMLGVALLMQKKFTPETVRSLEVAATDYPKAREHLAEVQAVLATH